MKTKPLAFSVHLLTGSGAALALMALVAATRDDWRLMFGWLGLALIVDGIDGPLARRRRYQAQRRELGRGAARPRGRLSHLRLHPGLCADLLAAAAVALGLIAALFIALTGVVYFADVRMKAEDNSFVGFPAVWQMPLLVLLTFDPPVWLTLGIILLLGLGQFTWLKFIHPVRTIRWRWATLAICVAWLVLAGWAVWENFDPPLTVKLGLAAASLWLLLAGIAMQYMPIRKPVSAE